MLASVQAQLKRQDEEAKKRQSEHLVRIQDIEGQLRQEVEMRCHDELTRRGIDEEPMELISPDAEAHLNEALEQRMAVMVVRNIETGEGDERQDDLQRATGGGTTDKRRERRRVSFKTRQVATTVDEPLDSSPGPTAAPTSDVEMGERDDRGNQHRIPFIRGVVSTTESSPRQTDMEAATMMRSVREPVVVDKGKRRAPQQQQIPSQPVSDSYQVTLIDN